MSRIERMIDIMDTMLDGRRRTGVELAYKYGVCNTTIYRDISQLSMIYPLQHIMVEERVAVNY